MTDLEITRLCAEAMEYRRSEAGERVPYSGLPMTTAVYVDKDGCFVCAVYNYAPLHDDAQAIALVKKFGLDIEYLGDTDYGKTSKNLWQVLHGNTDCRGPDLNRAIAECVARLQAAQGKEEK